MCMLHEILLNFARFYQSVVFIWLLIHSVVPSGPSSESCLTTNVFTFMIILKSVDMENSF